jgi:hypothetical protein
MQFQRQSTVEQEVLALEEVSEGLVCKRCLGIIDEPTSMTLVGEVLSRSAAPVLNWATKEIDGGNQSSPEDTEVHMKEVGDEEDYPIHGMDASNRLEMVRELDLQYKHLIEKYEALLHLHHRGSAREELPELSLQEELKMSGQFENIPKFDNNGAVDANNIEMDHQLFESGPMSLILMPDKPNKPFCGRLTSSAMSKTEEFSEAETYSSGFSERAEFKCSNKTTQTEEYVVKLAEMEEEVVKSTQTDEKSVKSARTEEKCDGFSKTEKKIVCDQSSDENFKQNKSSEVGNNPIEKDTNVSLVNLNQSTNPVDHHFPTTPAYKVIFKEIFCVLKKAHEDAPKMSNSEVSLAPSAPNKKSLKQKRSSSKEEKVSKVKLETKVAKEKNSAWDISDYPSLASASVARLINLEETYANVLRKGIIPFGE